MSNDVNRHKVFQTTKVRTSLKNDSCWIKKAQEETEEQYKARTDHGVEIKPAPVRQNLYVLSTAKKFEPQAPTEELIQNCVAQPEKSVTNTSAENKEEYTAAVYQSNVQHNDGAAEVSAEVHFAERIQNGEAQPVSSPKENPEQPAANTTAENKGEHADATVEQSNGEHNEAKVSADAHVEDPVAETSAAAGTEESKDTAEVPAAPAVKLKPQEEPSTKTEPANAVVETAVQPAEDSCEKSSPEQAAEDSVEAVAEVVAKSSSDTGDVVNATPEKEAALPDSVEATAEVVVKSSPEIRNVVNATPEKEAALPDSVKAVEVVAKSSSDTGDVVNATPGKEAALPDSGKAVAEVVIKSSPETSGVVNATPGKEAALPDSVKAVAGVAVAPENPDVTDVAGKKAAIQHPVEDVVKVAVESSPETPAVTGAAGEEVALQVSVEPVPDLVAATVPETPTQPAAETAVKSVERKVESAASAEPVLKTGAEEVVEFEVAPVVNTVVEQSVEPTPEREADGVVELNIEDAVESVTASDAEAVPDKFSYIPIELSEALDVEPPTTETAPKPLKDPKQSHTEETKPNQHSEHTNTSDMFKKSKEKEQSTQKQNGTRNTNVCSFCDKRIHGNIKLHLSEPVVTCHPDCLKCGVCAKVLGDLLTTMFLHNQVVKCGGCFAKALESEA